MFPVSRRIGKNTIGAKSSYFGKDNTPRKVAGFIKKQGVDYENCLVCIFDRNQLNLVVLVKPKADGSYVVRGLNKDLTLFIVAFDDQMKFNAVIQDMVIPK